MYPDLFGSASRLDLIETTTASFAGLVKDPFVHLYNGPRSRLGLSETRTKFSGASQELLLVELVHTAVTLEV